MGFLAGLASAVSAVSGLVGAKKKPPKQPSPKDNILSQAEGARAAAEKFGFNPLTMLQYGQSGGAMGGGGGPPPLASLEILSSGLMGLDDVVSGDAARRRQADQLEIDLAKIRLDQARSGVFQVQPQAVHGVGSGPSVLGRRSAVYSQDNVRPAAPRISKPVQQKAHNPNAEHPLRDSLGDVAAPDPTLDRGAGFFIGGKHFRATPGLSPAEVAEQEYGEVGGAAIGIGKLAVDAGYNTSQYLRQKELERAAADGERVYRRENGDLDMSREDYDAWKARKRYRTNSALPGLPVPVGGAGLAYPRTYPLNF